VPLVVGALFATCAFALLALRHSEPWHIYLGSSLLGVGIGLAFGAMANLIVEAVPPEETGVATGMNTIVRTIGGSVGAQIAATIIVTTTDASFTTAFTVSAVGLAVSFLVSLAIPGRRRVAQVGLVRSPS
jgi:dipeptide/tripeptide permease